MDHGKVLGARRHALRGAVADVAAWQRLRDDAWRELGADHPLSMRIECDLVMLRLPVRPVTESIADGTDLRARVERVLAPDEATAMAIRAMTIRCLARRGEPGDLDRVVALCQGELDRRQDAEVYDVWIGTARVDLATAVLDRVRFGRFDRLHRDLDAASGLDDGSARLDQARTLVDAEVGLRADRYGTVRAHTWRARAVQAEVMLAQARLETPDQAAGLAAAALTTADGLIARDWHREHAHTAGALRGQLLRVRALTSVGRRREAEREARLAAVLARRYDGTLRAEALLTLARTAAPRDRRAASAAAGQALALRESLLPATNHQVTEARELVGTLATGQSPEHDPEEPGERWPPWSAAVPDSLESLDVEDRDLAVAGTNELAAP
jgi:hypothetical protein